MVSCKFWPHNRPQKKTDVPKKEKNIRWSEVGQTH